MNENYYALAVCILHPEFLSPEQSFELYYRGICPKRNAEDVAADMLVMRSENIPWKEVAGLYGFSLNTAQSMASRFKHGVHRYKKNLEEG